MSSVRKGANRKKRPGRIALIVRFLKEVRAELKKVTWPDRKELVTYTSVVILCSFVIAAFIGLVDMGFSVLLRSVLNGG